MDSAQNHAYRRSAKWENAEWGYSSRPDSATAPHFITPRMQTAPARRIAELFGFAGIEIGGSRPWDLQVHDDRFYKRLLSGGSLAAGESYMDGWWDAEVLDELCTRVHQVDLAAKVGKWETTWLALKGRVFNRQTESQSAEVALEHYDLGNDLYEAMLDRRMQYTCGYWKDATTLDQAQENKLRLICRKIGLEAGMTVLELGGGFGGLAHFMASEYGCHVVSYNISREQVAYGREWCRHLPVRFEHKDYRDAALESAPFDRVVSIGLCEHIGRKNYPAFLALAHEKLKSKGLFLLHTIGGNASSNCTDPWVDKYIFPNGMIPSIAQLGKAMERLWVVEDWHNFGPDYDRTLIAWWQNFDRAWPALQKKYGERFYRMWKYYLLGCAGGFRARTLQLWQIVLSKGDIGAYAPVR
jgi:cyclopropane-fatty-acyl-phospholipid synthase